jgi:hypothetical protein
VRLPRDWRGPKDWLEPPDGLVPLGARVSKLTEADGVPSHRLPDEEQPPPGADAFWSEGSAALQDALQAPGWGAAWGQDETGDAEAGRAGAPDLGARPWRPALLRGLSSPRRAWLGGAVAVVCLAGLIGAIQSAPPARHLALADHPPSSDSTSAGAPRLQIPLHRGHPGDAVRVRATAVGRERASFHPSVTVTRPAGPHARSTATAATRTVAVSQPVSTSRPASQPTSSAVPTGTNPDASVTSDGGALSSRSAPSNPTPAAGPTGPGAPFGPGRLG